MTATTRDALFGGALVLEQPARGYRMNVDAVLLAAFAASVVTRARRACDLGAGVGAVGLSLLHLGAVAHVTLVESDAFAAGLARSNAQENGLFSRTETITNDVAAFAARTAGARGTFDLVVTNPPYVETGAGRTPRDERRAKARVGSLATFVRAARTLVRARGRVCLCYPAPELASALATLRAAGLEAKRARFVHAAADRPARIVLLMAQPAKRGGLAIDPPLVERDGVGLGEELKALFSTRRSIGA